MIYIVFLLIDRHSIDKYISTDYIKVLIDKYLTDTLSDVFFITFGSVIKKLSLTYGCDINGHLTTYLDIDHKQNNNVLLDAITVLHKSVKNTKNQIYPFILAEDPDVHNYNKSINYVNGVKILNSGCNVIFGYDYSQNSPIDKTNYIIQSENKSVKFIDLVINQDTDMVSCSIFSRIIGLQSNYLKILKNTLSMSNSIKNMSSCVNFLLKNSQIKLNLINLGQIHSTQYCNYNTNLIINRQWIKYACQFMVCLITLSGMMYIYLNLTFY